MYAARIAATLVERGVDTEAIDGVPTLLGLSDSEVLERGRTDCRAVVTENHADFCRLARGALQDGQGHHGLVLVPSHRREVGWLVRALDQLARANPGNDDLVDREIWL